MLDRMTIAELAVALACGLLVGADRERAEGGEEGGAFGGIRTYPLIALLAAISELISIQVGHWFLGLSFAGVLGWIGVCYYHQAGKGKVGLTSEVSALICFGCGVLSVQQAMGLAFAVAIATTFFLTLKDRLHLVAREHLSEEDRLATLKFLVVAFVMLPLLPSITYTVAVPESFLWGRFVEQGLTIELVNPAEVGWMIVLIAGIGFVGYLASKLLGARKGLGLSAFLGGLVSSTAVTLSFAGRVKAQPSLLKTGVVAILLASATMYVRVLVEVAFVHPPFLLTVTRVVLPMALVGFGFCLVYFLKKDHAASDSGAEGEEVELKNPFLLSEAVKFGLLYAVVKFVAKLAQTVFGSGGLYISGFLAGLTDVDAITLSVSQLVGSEEALDPFVGVTTILIATIANSIVKGSLTLGLGGRKLGLRICVAFAVIGVVGVGALVLWTLAY